MLNQKFVIDLAWTQNKTNYNQKNLLTVAETVLKFLKFNL